MKLYSKAILFVIAVGILSCSKVPISGRRQVNLLPESQLMSMSLTQYGAFLKENPPMSDQIEDTKRVKRVGSRISHAVEIYMKENGFSSRVKNYKWEFNHTK